MSGNRVGQKWGCITAECSHRDVCPARSLACIQQRPPGQGLPSLRLLRLQPLLLLNHH